MQVMQVENLAPVLLLPLEGFGSGGEERPQDGMELMLTLHFAPDGLMSHA